MQVLRAGPYKNLKRKGLEKKLTCFVCGFVLRFLKLLFYANLSFVLLCGGPIV